MAYEWPVDRTCLPDVSSPADAEQMREAENTAVMVLWALTGRRFGCAEVIARPNVRPHRGWYPVLEGGEWRNVTCHSSSMFVRLPGPVCEVLEVTVDGVVVPADQYQLEGDRLFRTVGAWPSQDGNLPLGQPGTWSIRYTRGEPPPAGAAKMVGILASEFYKACAGERCALPRRVQQVSQRGVTYQRVDPLDVIQVGGTGITEVDLWIHAVNPYGMAQPPVVSSPDYPGVL